MPGRQAHGRSLLPAAVERKTKPERKSRAKAVSTALNAFALAEEQVPVSRKGIRTRYLDPEPEDRNPKRQRNDEDDEDEGVDDEDEDEDDARAPRKKRARKEGEDDDGLSGSDSEGNEWHVGVNGDEEDSDIDSDGAFGESDEEKFEGFSFPTSKRKKAKAEAEDEQESDVDDDGESLGSEAIDLATALDQYSSDDSGEEEASGSEEEEEDEDESSAESVDSDDSDEDDDDPTKLDKLQGLISGFGGQDDEEEDASKTRSKPKLSFEDLGLSGIKDPNMKKSLKLMKKEDKETRPGTAKKLSVPLARRQQGKLDRAVALEKTKETLERWQDTVQHNRRSEHLVFPLAQNTQDHGLDHGEFAPLHKRAAVGSELEQTILAIMEESGLGPKKPEPQTTVDEDGNERLLTNAEVRELQRERRQEREKFSREQARAKRIKKIKSKTYRRIHRKEIQREEDANKLALIEAGELDSDEEREAHDRRRAMERMGVRHKESKWAKLGKKAGRAVWDESFRASLTDQALQDQQLRQRVEGRQQGSDEDEDEEDGDDGFGSGEEEDRHRLLRQLDRAEKFEDDEPKSKLMQMAFMQRGEEQRKKENDELVRQLRRELDSENDDESEEDDTEDVGRRQFGAPPSKTAANDTTRTSTRTDEDGDGPKGSKAKKSLPKTATTMPFPTAAAEPEAPSAPGAPGAWSRGGKETRKNKKASAAKVEGLDLSEAALIAPRPAKTKQKETADRRGSDSDSSSDDGETIHLPISIRDRELIKRAFAGEDVVGEFEREKRGAEAEDDDKEIDNTLPGWGGWVGDGVSKREKSRQSGRFVTKVDGVKKKNRADYKMDKVIINEKRTRKV